MSPSQSLSALCLLFSAALVLLGVGCDRGGPPEDGGRRGPGGPGGGGAPAEGREPPGQADCTTIAGEARLPEGAGEAQGDLEVFFLEPGSLDPDGFPNRPPMDFLHVGNRKDLPLEFQGCAPQAELEVAAFVDMDGDGEIRGVGDLHGHTAITVTVAGLTGVVILLDQRIEEAKKGDGKLEAPPSDEPR